MRKSRIKWFYSVVLLVFVLFAPVASIRADIVNSGEVKIQGEVPRYTDPANQFYYRYTAKPYDFYYNPYTGEWKMVQVIPTLQHMVNVMFDGWARYGPWVPRVYRYGDSCCEKS